MGNIESVRKYCRDKGYASVDLVKYMELCYIYTVDDLDTAWHIQDIPVRTFRCNFGNIHKFSRYRCLVVL